jgi:asparagine synthase (glutamine-hydrolysing)
MKSVVSSPWPERAARRRLPPADRAALEASRVLEQPFLELELGRSGVIVRGTAHRVWGGPGGPVGYAAWHWDGEQLEACTDRFGFRPLFYWAHRGGIAISSSLVKLLALGAPAELDEAAVAVFLRLGFFLGEDTPFRAVRVLPPNGRLRWAGGSLRLTGGYPAVRHCDLPRGDAVDAYIAAVRGAIRGSLPVENGCVVPLSGGRDSRHILLELCAAGAPPDACVTLRNYPPRGALDLALAETVARAVGVRHIVLEEDPSRVRSELRKNLETHFCADEHAWFLPLADLVRGRWSTVYDGIAGDVLSAGHRLDPQRLELMRSGHFEALADLLFDEGHVRFLSHRAARRFDRTLATERLVAELERHVDAPNPVGSFFFWNRTRREIALVPFGLLDGVGRVVTPFLHPEVYDLVASFPAHLFLDRRFHTDAIRRAHPRYAAIPFDTELMASGPRAEVGAAGDHFRRLLREIAAYVAAARDRTLVHRSALLGRALYWSVRGDFSDAPAMTAALYLMQLETLTRWLS